MSNGAVVTGAAGLIGSAITRVLSARGIPVAAVDRVKAEVPPQTDGSAVVVPVVADLGSTEERERAVTEAQLAVGPIRYLINNAADAQEAPLLRSTDDQWRHSLEVNVVAPAALTRALAEDLSAAAGVVVNISSVRGLAALPGAAAYEASKAALIALTRAITAELGHRGVRAVTVCPGAIVRDAERWLDPMPPGYAAAWTATQPMGLVGTDYDVAELVAFLCSDAARHINGTEIVIDGGALAQHPATPALRMNDQLEMP